MFWKGVRCGNVVLLGGAVQNVGGAFQAVGGAFQAVVGAFQPVVGAFQTVGFSSDGGAPGVLYNWLGRKGFEVWSWRCLRR